MATSARSRGLPNYAMPSGSGPGSDKPQQPISSGFSSSNLYPNANIWNSFSVIDRPIGSREADENPSGSSALNVNSEADVWGSRPWNTDGQNRPVSTSPQRTRDGTVTNGSAFFDRSVGLRNGNGLGGTAFQGEGNGYNTAFGAPKRASQESSYIDSLPSFSHSRDTSIPPSRQSQGSPGYPSEAYRGHTPNNSIHSQRIAPNHSASLSVQSLNPTINQNINQRAFNLNRQIEDDVSAQFSRATLDGASNGGSAFNPASNPFQLNPNTQPWLNDNGISPRLGNGLDMNGDTLASQLAMRRPSAGRISPGATYRLESSANPRSYAPTPDPWAPSRPSSKDPRTNEFERRSSMQQSYPQNMQTPFYPNQYPFSNFTPQYPPNPYDPYGNTSYRNPLIPNYGIPSINQSYPLNSMQNAARSSRDQDPSKGVRSAVLDSFRTNNKSSRRYELRDIYDHVVEFSGDQHGSRFIQQKLETANSDEKEVVFREIAPNAIQLMKDVFGNYVVQKFFEHGNQVQKKILADKMKGKIVDLSVQIYACRVVQKALEHVLVEQQEEMCLELERECLKVMKDQNGNHVIQKVVELVPREHMGFIMDAMRGSISTLAQHMYGCRVIQRILEYGTEEDKAEIMKELYPIANMLIMDQYGNYVAQHVIANGKLEDRTRMIQLVMAQLVSFSRHKFASNVVEKCIQFGTPEQRTSIREGLTGVGSDGNPLLPQLMRDQFGNYVIQKLLVQLQGEEKEILAEEIKPQWSTLKKHGNSRQLQAMEKALGLGQGSGSRPTSGQMDSNSQGPTPVLTNETNSPQSSSPPSTHASALEQASGDAAANKVNGVDPEVQTTST